MSESKETDERLQAILRGAFAGPPTPLKDIPTREGEARKLGQTKNPKRSRNVSANLRYKKRQPEG